MINTAQLLEDSLLVIWNDRNEETRLEAMKNIYAPGIQFFESDPGQAIVGHEALNKLISKLQSAWPIEFQFELNGPSRVNHDIQIASWNLGPLGATPAATGMDVAVIENNLIRTLYLFLNAAE